MMKKFAIRVRTVDGDRTFVITAASKASAMELFVSRWDEQLVSYTVIAIDNVL